MTILNEDLDRGRRNYWRSETVQDLAKLGHGTWSHVSFGDPLGAMKTDKALYGAEKARAKHVSVALQSGKDWQHPAHRSGNDNRGREHARQLLASTEELVPAASSMGPADVQKASTAPAKPPSVSESQRSVPSSRRAPREALEEVGWSERSAKANMHPMGARNRLRPELPPLWAPQPRYSEAPPGCRSVTPSSAARSSSAASVSGARGGFAMQRQQGQLRNVASEPDLFARSGPPKGPVGSSGPLGASLMAHVLAPPPAQGPSDGGTGCRYTGTFVFG